MFTLQEISYLPIEQYKADLLAVCGEFDICPPDKRGVIWGGFAACERAGIEVALVATNLQFASRTPKNIRRDSGENYFLILQKFGRALMAQKDVAAMLFPGDMILVDSSQPSDFRFFKEKSMQISLHLPRTQIIERFGRDIVGGVFFSGNRPTSKAIHLVIEKILHYERSPQECGYLQDALFGLIGASLYDEDNRSRSAPSHDLGTEGPLLGRALEYMDSRFRDPEFTVPDIARAYGVSARQVQRAFKNLGVTPTNFLLAKRLEYARSKLLDRNTTTGGERISTIAFNAGFSDISYFNRRFREFFSCSPRECQSDSQ